jgi:hypothetical protein
MIAPECQGNVRTRLPGRRASQKGRHHTLKWLQEPCEIGPPGRQNARRMSGAKVQPLKGVSTISS